MEKIWIGNKEKRFDEAPSPKHKLAGDISDLCLNSKLDVTDYLGAIECAKWSLLERWLEIVQRDRNNAVDENP